MKKTLLSLALITILSLFLIQTVALAATDAPPSVDNPFATDAPPSLTIDTTPDEPPVMDYTPEPPPAPPVTPKSGPETLYIVIGVMALGIGTFAFKQIKANK